MTEMPSSSRIAESARDWWRDLQPSDEQGQPRAGDRVALARLRRAATPSDAMAEEATLALFRRLGLRSENFPRLPRVALIVMVLAHVRADAVPGDNGFRPAAARAVGRISAEDAELGQDEPAALPPAARRSRRRRAGPRDAPARSPGGRQDQCRRPRHLALLLERSLARRRHPNPLGFRVLRGGRVGTA